MTLKIKNPKSRQFGGNPVTEFVIFPIENGKVWVSSVHRRDRIAKCVNQEDLDFVLAQMFKLLEIEPLHMLEVDPDAE